MKTFFLFTGLFLMTAALAQQNTLASGGNALGANGTLSYSVGQIAVQNVSNTQVSLSEGLQQPFEIMVLSNITYDPIYSYVSIYPNPTADILNLSIEKTDTSLQYELFDINGKIVKSTTQVEASLTPIAVDNLNQGIYFLTISRDNQAVKQFKFIKK